MALDKRDIVKGELIGLKAEVIDSRNKSDTGTKGDIIDETKSTLLIEDSGRSKRVFKSNVLLRITIKGKQFKIKGEQLEGRPKERVKT